MIRPGETRRETLPILAGFRVASPGFWPPRIGEVALGRTAKSGVSCETGERTWNFPAGRDRLAFPRSASTPFRAIPRTHHRRNDRRRARKIRRGRRFCPRSNLCPKPLRQAHAHELLMLIIKMRSRFVQDQIANFSTSGGKFFQFQRKQPKRRRSARFFTGNVLGDTGRQPGSSKSCLECVYHAEVMATTEKDFDDYLLYVLIASALPCARGLDSRDERAPFSPKFVSHHGLRNGPAVVEWRSWFAGLCRIASEGGLA